MIAGTLDLYIGFNVETVNYKNVNLTAWDVGGRDKIVRSIKLSHY